MQLTEDNRKLFKPAAGEIPTAPGVYRFSDSAGEPLYIGKAKNLRARLANYFQPWHVLLPRTQRMLSLATRLDWTVVGSETEALVLEQQWIRAFLPPYNVIFRDDKTYPYLAVTLGSTAPRLEITRRTNIPGAKYFGPYPKVWALKQTVALLQQAFAIRTCSDADYNRAMKSGKPCLMGQIGKCFGPCSGKVSVAEHRKVIEDLVAFMQTLDDSKVRQIEGRMQQAAQSQNYELAAKLRDQMLALKQIIESNNIVLSNRVSADFFALALDDLSASVQQFIVRDGRLRGERSWQVQLELEQTAAQLMQQVLQDAYQHSPAPKTVYVSVAPESTDAVQEVLRRSRPRGGSVRVHSPERGENAALMQTALKNALDNLQRSKLKRTNSLTSRTDALAGLQRALGLPQAPLVIECVDVSHLQGSDVVASLVVFVDGLPLKNAYRKYKIPHTTDDTDSIYQVVLRRARKYAHADEAARSAQAEISAAALNGEITGLTASALAKQQRSQLRKPHLLLVDGGPGQVAAASRALAAAGVADVPLCGIAKRLEEIWLPGEQFPVILPRGSEELFLIQRLRDEAHRVAISFQRQQRKSSIGSVLQQLPGLGKKRVAALLQHFGSAKQVANATPAQLAQVPGIGEQLAEQIAQALSYNSDMEKQ